MLKFQRNKLVLLVLNFVLIFSLVFAGQAILPRSAQAAAPYEFDSDIQGFSSGYISVSHDANGWLHSAWTNVAARVESPIDFGGDMDTNKILTIRMRTSSVGTAEPNIGVAVKSVKIWFSTTTDTALDDWKDKSIYIDSTNTWQTYVIDMGSELKWTGTLRQISLAFAGEGYGDPCTGSFDIDYIRLSAKAAYTVPGYVAPTSAPRGGTEALLTGTWNQGAPLGWGDPAGTPATENAIVNLYDGTTHDSTNFYTMNGPAYDAADRGYLGIDLGAGNAKKLTKVMVWPRYRGTAQTYYLTQRAMYDVVIQGSNTSSTDGFTELGRFTSIPATGVYTTVGIYGSAAYRYYRLFDEGGLGTDTKTMGISELQFYTVNLEANADLSALSASCGALSPAFDAATTAYTINVANTVTSTDIAATKAGTYSTITSGTGTGIALAVGDNVQTVKVTAEDGTVKDYVITINRAALSTDTSIISVTAPATLVDGVILVEVSPATTEVALALTLAAGASFEIYSDEDCTSMYTNKTVTNLMYGANIAYVKITAEAGNSRPVVPFIVTRTETLAQAKLNAKDALNTALAGYLVGDYSGANWTALNGAKTDGDTAIDEATDNAGVQSAKLAAIAAMDAVLTAAEEAAAAAAAVAKAEGSELQADVDAAQALVTALPNGAPKTALQERIDAVQDIIDFESSNSDLATLTVDGKTFTFNPTTYVYKIDVASAGEMTINATTASSMATVAGTGIVTTVNGKLNYFKIIVTAEDGTKKSYLIKFVLAV